jgi:hypothetical protein
LELKAPCEYLRITLIRLYSPGWRLEIPVPSTASFADYQCDDLPTSLLVVQRGFDLCRRILSPDSNKAAKCNQQQTKINAFS